VSERRWFSVMPLLLWFIDLICGSVLFPKMGSFKYGIATLIELVESRPCLWDKAADCFKDKVEKCKEWREVYQFLEDDFF
jgi:hypothetical protein